MARPKEGKEFYRVNVRIEKGESLAKFNKAKGLTAAATFIHSLIDSATSNIQVTNREIDEAKADNK